MKDIETAPYQGKLSFRKDGYDWELIQTNEETVALFSQSLANRVVGYVVARVKFQEEKTLPGGVTYPAGYYPQLAANGFGRDAWQFSGNDKGSIAAYERYARL